MERITRGKTRPNRHHLWLTWLRMTFLNPPNIPSRLIVDLGFGEKPYGTIELFNLCAQLNVDAEVVGLETSEHRYKHALALSHPKVRFLKGSLNALHSQTPTPFLVRALNVLRQYPPSEVPHIRTKWLQALPIDATLTEGTTDRDGDILAMWRVCRSPSTSKLVFGITGRKGFAPKQLLAVLPCDLRWLNPKPPWVIELFDAWTDAWDGTERYKHPVERFAKSIWRLAEQRPTWIERNEALWSLGIVELNADHIMADIAG